MRYVTLLGLVTLCTIISTAQHQELQEKPKIWQSESKNLKDTLSILAAFKSGTINGHFRYFLSSTINKGELTDYIANAVGGGLRYETGSYHGFKVGVSGFYIFNAGSSDLSVKDPISGQSNRYEVGLFDITDPNVTTEINRLEEFFIKYEQSNLKITFGRQLLNTPFVNLQDGRMRPTAVEGLWIESKLNKHQFQLGYIYGIAPRSTSKWYSVEDAIGLYPVGIAQDGTKSQYYGNIKTKGIILANYQYKPSQKYSFNIWNFCLENILNTTLLQLDQNFTIENRKLYTGFQLAAQTKAGNGGNSEPVKTYKSDDKAVYTIGFRVGIKNEKWDHSLNFNYITSGGRYLMPREFGRDYFFTFMPRERNEGFGNVTAVVLKSNYQMAKETGIQLSGGIFLMPDVKNYKLNKYSMPSYTQVNLDFRHRFSGHFNGFEGQILWVSKFSIGDTYGFPKNIINKVDMHLLNFVLNFRF